MAVVDSTKEYQNGRLACGYQMSGETDRITDVFAWFFALTVFVFTYAVMLEGASMWYAAGGFITGFTLLFYLYGQNFDKVYFHLGKFKIGGEAVETQGEQITVEYEDGFEELE